MILLKDNNYPHKEAIENLEIISPLISLIEESKENYIKENLSQHLHKREIKLLKQANSHSMPVHKKARINQYKKLQETPEQINEIFNLHKNIFIKKYQKLENKGLVEVNTKSEDLPYDVTLTSKGKEIIKEIKSLEMEWNKYMMEDIDREKLLELLKEVTHKAAPINHKHRKQQKFLF